jgi:hypothetical protein
MPKETAHSNVFLKACVHSVTSRWQGFQALDANLTNAQRVRANVEFPAIHQQRALNISLDYPLPQVRSIHKRCPQRGTAVDDGDASALFIAVCNGYEAMTPRALS